MLYGPRPPSRAFTTGPSTQSPALSLPTTGTRASRVHHAGNYTEARMADYDPAPTSDEELEQAYQEKYG